MDLLPFRVESVGFCLILHRGVMEYTFGLFICRILAVTVTIKRTATRKKWPIIEIEAHTAMEKWRNRIGEQSDIISPLCSSVQAQFDIQISIEIA